jgi:alkanesulfonate monooxygenase SsuD/methylene tetrahydromethanopterin reductase-like flavin-dependent oxidoreductase (luciferase family)
MRLCVMIEGQEGVTWEQWVALAHAAEEHGFEALFRSDHYGSVAGAGERGALDAWTTLAGLAAVTHTLRLGTLVSPVTFRHPAVLAKSVVTVDHISGGRVEVGMGAGWLRAEHERFGFPFPPTRERMDQLEQQLETVQRQWAEELPPPVQEPHPPLILGGSGGRRSLALAARWADEYNTVYATPERCRELRETLDDRLPLSVMTGFLIGADRNELEDRRRRLAEQGDEPAEAWITGTPDEAVEQLAALADAGVERVMLQHLLHTDLDVLALIAAEVARDL